MSYTIEGESGPWEVVIGLEVHAQVLTESKLFSGAPTGFGAEPNTQVAFLDAGMPGMLPVVNKACIDQAIKTGLGICGNISKYSTFDRKNYFYADLPTGYQISQFYHPIVTDAYIDIDLEDGSTKRINIERLHLEQDAGKSTHDITPKSSHIDLNRAGVALMEIVSKPELRSAEEAKQYVKKLRSIVRYLGTCDGNMDQGSFRVDANISLRRPGEPFGTRAEIKNINSVRFLGQAIEHEIIRQMGILEDGGRVVQETRLFDPNKGETRSMRSKENAQDYRYFPDPDLLPLKITDERIEAIRQSLPELPDAKKSRFKEQYGLTDDDANVLVSEKEIADYYDTLVRASKSHDKKQAAKLCANWLINEVFARTEGMAIADLPIVKEQLAFLVDLIIDGTISGKIAKEIFAKMWEHGCEGVQKLPSDLVEELGLKQVSDEGSIRAEIVNVLSANQKQVADYKAGQEKLFGFFVGQVMKAMKGKGNPEMINKIMKEELSK